MLKPSSERGKEDDSLKRQGHAVDDPIHLAASRKRNLSGWESNPAFPRFASSDRRVYYPIYDQRDGK
jgi:hypothetical protein